MTPPQANAKRMPDAVRRAMLAAVPDVGRVTRRRGRIVLDFSPDLRGSDRYLWSHVGRAFESEAVAESIRQRICHDVTQCRWTSAAMLEHYDEAKDVRRGRVVAKLAELVGETRGK